MNDLDSAIIEIANYYTQKAEEDFVVAANYANNEMFDEFNRMYDTFIKQFYNYKTSAYIRHWEGRPGTKKGSNLYYGNQTTKHITGGLPYIDFKFDSSQMADDYQHDSADTVLNQILSGNNIIHGSAPLCI